MSAFLRWFTGAYFTAVLAGLLSAPWIFPTWAYGLFFIPFTLPYVIAGALLGLSLQWLLESLGAAGRLKTPVLLALTVGAGGLGMYHLTDRTIPYAIIGAASAVSGTLLSQHDGAWRRGWLVVIAAAAAATGVVIVTLGI